jgi:hypothetical protein
MAKVLFMPVGIVAGLLASVAGRRVLERVWNLVDAEADGPPTPKEPEATWPKLIAGLAIQGAIFAAVRGAFEHAARRGFARLTGSWPG